MKIDRHHFGDATNHGITSSEAAAIPGTLADGDDPFRIGYRVVGSFQRRTHVFRHGTGHQQNVRMARRSDKTQAEALKIVIGVAQCMDFQFASVAGACIDLTD